jgi:hypothetical protein
MRGQLQVGFPVFAWAIEYASAGATYNAGCGVRGELTMTRSPASDDSMPRETPEAPDNTEPKIDPNDLDGLRRSPNSAPTLCVKKEPLTVPVCKPSKEWWVRIHPDEDYRSWVHGILKLKDSRETYLVHPSLCGSLDPVCTLGPCVLFTAKNLHGDLFIWPVRLTRDDERLVEWDKAELRATAMAARAWVRGMPIKCLGAYVVHEARANFPEPEWPSVPFSELLRVAFKNRLIESPDHPVLKQLTPAGGLRV